MGVSSSILADLMLKPFIVKCDHETGCQCSALNVDRQLETIRNEVKQQERLITENVIQEITSKEDTMVLRYSDLKDMTTISKHIEKIFEDEPEAIEFLTNAASKMIAVFHSSSEMKELLRLNQVKKVMKCGDKTVGMELHYKVMIIEEKKGIMATVGRGTTDTVVILGYKFIAHALDVDPEELPDDKDLRSLRF